ncbi:hypothetical protein Q7F17_15050 [Escherichia coli]|uniref:hypothetical protein n=1 Tax=Enterobacteriaceae TaxID=543 RepID=UPI000D74254F|nr:MULTISPECIES: hypothetical protein [Enterobacteriaceae]MBD0791129.1 hypothetical protein [Klebsiella sp. K5]MCZ3534613.1 hypothetical protein [Klebsiella variicola]MDD1952879.1 hypothetical protein [Klebsiella variicola]MDO8867177.1 hypothetical protein [Escherichia coli]PXK13362.1 hypothetical protein DMR09_00535 [Klebsiella variicola]
MRFYIYKSWQRVDHQPAFEVTSLRRGDDKTDTAVALFDCESISLAAAYALPALQAAGVETRNSVVFMED